MLAQIEGRQPDILANSYPRFACTSKLRQQAWAKMRPSCSTATMFPLPVAFKQKWASEAAQQALTATGLGAADADFSRPSSSRWDTAYCPTMTSGSIVSPSTVTE